MTSYEQVAKSEKEIAKNESVGGQDWATIGKIGFVVCCWWGSSALFNVASLNAFRSDENEGNSLAMILLVTWVQMVIAAVLSLGSLIAGFGRPGTEQGCLGSGSDRIREVLKMSGSIGALHMLGNLTTNAVLAFSSQIGKTQAFKSLEPVFVVGALFFFNRPKFFQDIGKWEFGWLSFTVFGVVIALAQPPFNAIVVLAAFACNTFFGIRSVLTKVLRGKTSAPTMIELFCACSVNAAVLNTILLPFGLALGSGLQADFPIWESFKSGVCFFFYNILSFIVLEMVSSTNHSLLKLGKRIAILVGGALLVGEHMEPFQWFGMFLAITGIAIYREKSKTMSTVLNRGLQLGVFVVIAFLISNGPNSVSISGLKNSTFPSVVNLPNNFQPKEKIVYVEKEKIVYRDKPADSVQEKIVYRDKPVEKIVEKVVYRDKGSNFTGPSDGDKWLQCLEAVQARILDTVRDIFVDDPNYPSVLLVDPAHHGNFGDSMIARGERYLFARLGYEDNAVEQCRLMQSNNRIGMCNSDYSTYKKSIVHAVHGGGNWGDLWRAMQEVRLKNLPWILKAGKTFVSMPQSYYFGSKTVEKSDAARMKEAIRSTIGLEKGKEKVILLWRQEDSFQKASEAYPFVDNRLIPDIAFMLGPILPSVGFRNQGTELTDFILLIRGDKEGRFRNKRNTKYLDDRFEKLGKKHNRKFTYNVVDWWDSPKYFKPRKGGYLAKGYHWEYPYRLNFAQFPEMLSTGRVVITDRLHASILSLLMFKYHVVLDNNYKKSTYTRKVALDSSKACSSEKDLRYRVALDLDVGIDLGIELLDEYHKTKIQE